MPCHDTLTLLMLLVDVLGISPMTLASCSATSVARLTWTKLKAGEFTLVRFRSRAPMPGAVAGVIPKASCRVEKQVSTTEV